MTRWACESPLHEGARTDVHPLDRFTRRTTFYRHDGGERLHERSLDRICRRCIAIERSSEDQVSLL
jgi:hypothetical protein